MSDHLLNNKQNNEDFNASKNVFVKYSALKFIQVGLGLLSSVGVASMYNKPLLIYISPTITGFVFAIAAIGKFSLQQNNGETTKLIRNTTHNKNKNRQNLLKRRAQRNANLAVALGCLGSVSCVMGVYAHNKTHPVQAIKIIKPSSFSR